MGSRLSQVDECPNILHLQLQCAICLLEHGKNGPESFARLVWRFADPNTIITLNERLCRVMVMRGRIGPGIKADVLSWYCKIRNNDPHLNSPINFINKIRCTYADDVKEVESSIFV